MFEEFSRNPGDKSPLDGLVIRPAGEADIPELARITAERQGGDVSVYIDSHTKHVRQSGETDRDLVLVAELGRQIIGFGKAAYFSPPAGSPPDVAPEGWYLSGVIVTPPFRRRGVADQLTRARLDWVRRHSSCVYYFASARNQVTIALHRRFGFMEVTRAFSFPGVSFTGGVGILFRVDLKAQ